MILFVVALVLPTLPILVLFITGIFLLGRWFSVIIESDLNASDMKVPTFYSSSDNDDIGYAIIMMPVVGIVFGGIHCIGWYFNFPSSVEAMLWRVSSAVLTGIAFLFPFVLAFLANYLSELLFINVATIILLAYIVSRLLLLVEAFISLRHLTPGMLELVKWTSFIPHI